MIIIDYSQLAFAAALENILMKEECSLSMLRHMVLNSLRHITHKYRTTYGPKVVIAMDDRHYWRRDVFPHYKYKRKAQREASGQDWKKVFELLEPLKSEFQTSLPYHVLRVPGAEADDIIGVLTIAYAPHESILIVSSDKDFIQLQSQHKVSQYSLALKKMVKHENPQHFLREMILRGDTGDGIPNILSADDTFVTGVRQKPLTAKKVSEWLPMSPETFCTSGDMLRNYRRNEELIDLNKIPTTMAMTIRAAFDTSKTCPRNDFFHYLVSHQLSKLVSSIHEF